MIRIVLVLALSWWCADSRAYGGFYGHTRLNLGVGAYEPAPTPYGLSETPVPPSSFALGLGFLGFGGAFGLEAEASFFVIPQPSGADGFPSLRFGPILGIGPLKFDFYAEINNQNSLRTKELNSSVFAVYWFSFGAAAGVDLGVVSAELLFESIDSRSKLFDTTENPGSVVARQPTTHLRLEGAFDLLLSEISASVDRYELGATALASPTVIYKYEQEIVHRYNVGFTLPFPFLTMRLSGNYVPLPEDEDGHAYRAFFLGDDYLLARSWVEFGVGYE